jgi:TnpA family transposase
MPRRSVLSAAERRSLVAIPTLKADLHRLYGLSDADLGLIREHRGDANRLGFAVLLAYMRYPGVVLGVEEDPAPQVLTFLADQIGVLPDAWDAYDRAQRPADGMRLSCKGRSGSLRLPCRNNVWLLSLCPSQRW